MNLKELHVLEKKISDDNLSKEDIDKYWDNIPRQTHPVDVDPEEEDFDINDLLKSVGRDDLVKDDRELSELDKLLVAIGREDLVKE